MAKSSGRDVENLHPLRSSLNPFTYSLRKQKNPRDIKWPRTTDYEWLDSKKIFIVGGCELTYFSNYLEDKGLITYHTFQNNAPMDPFVEMRSPESQLTSFNPDHVVLSQIQKFRQLVGRHQDNRDSWGKEEQLSSLDSLVSELQWSIEEIRSDIQCPIWVVSHIGTHVPAHGIHDYRGVNNGTGILEFNMHYKIKLYEMARTISSVYILDADIAFESIGKWPIMELPFIRPHEPYGGHLETEGAQVLAEFFHHQLLVTSKIHSKVKCVILDCDNTLWEGIIREDGLGGISVFGNRLHRMEQLSKRGIMFALCSKNDPEDEELIMQALKSHSDNSGIHFHQAIVTSRINWSTKSSNIRSIAKELNIGTDSLAFFDDNEFERDEVRSSLPEVMVFSDSEIEQAPDWHMFHPSGDLGQDSSSRIQKYKEEKIRKVEQQDFGEDNFEDFLASCGLILEIREPRLDELPRISELLQRTNQMNATLKRMDLADIQALHGSDNSAILIVRLTDNYGEYGIIGVAISNSQNSNLELSELAFSCRAMGRKVEHALIQEVIGLSIDKGMSNISIQVVETSRNHQIIKILSENGFVRESLGEDLLEMVLNLSEFDGGGRVFPPWFQIISPPNLE